MTAIAAALVVEVDGRVTEAVKEHGEFVDTARRIVKHINHQQDGKQAFADSGYMYYVLVADSVVYLCVGKEDDLKGRIAFGFLEAVRNHYDEAEYEDRQNVSSFARFIQAQMAAFSDPARLDKLTQVQNKVEDVKNEALNVLDGIVGRQLKLEQVLDDADKLSLQADEFAHVAREQKCMERRRNIFWTLALVFSCLLLLAIVVGIILLIVYA